MASYTLKYSADGTFKLDMRKHVAQAFVVASGVDTVGVVKITVDGLFELWRKGTCLGVYDNFKKVKRVIARHDDGSTL